MCFFHKLVEIFGWIVQKPSSDSSSPERRRFFVLKGGLSGGGIDSFFKCTILFIYVKQMITYFCIDEQLGREQNTRGDRHQRLLNIMNQPKRADDS